MKYDLEATAIFTLGTLQDNDTFPVIDDREHGDIGVRLDLERSQAKG